MRQCPSEVDLNEFVESGEPESQVGRHVAGCAGCRAAVEELLKNAEFLKLFRSVEAIARPHDSRGGGPPERPRHSAPLAEPDLIAGYEILEEIHRGGQGVVYRAVQIATQRTVAVKMLLAGCSATDREKQRFEREARIAANLRHPNIVTVYDGWFIADGRYAFAMEHIEGEPLDQWSAGLARARGNRRAVLRERLKVMAKVCDAVLCAHQHTIVHRDLKPANILVDAAGEPHVLDFGIARDLGPDDPTRLTQAGGFAGTLAYASPEQVSGDPSRVDTRTDIYSLGVIMYELMTGQMPYSVDGPIGAAIRNIEEVDPAPPSRRTPDGDGPFVDGEVSTIFLKAMAKDPSRRYQTVAGLGNDIRRYLAGEAIEARRDSTWYVLRKVALRNRRLIAVAAAGLLVVLTGIGVAGYGISHAAIARARADGDRQRADSESLRARALDEVTRGLLLFGDSRQDESPRGALVRSFNSLQERIDLGALAGEPDYKTAVQSMIGTFASHFPELLPVYEVTARAVLQDRIGRLGVDDADTGAALHDLARILLSRGRVQESEQFVRRAIEVFEKTAGEEDPATLSSQELLARILAKAGSGSAGADLAPRCVEVRRRHAGSARFTDLDLASSLLTSATTSLAAGRVADALARAEEAMRIALPHVSDDHALVIEFLSVAAEAGRSEEGPPPEWARSLGAGSSDDLVAVLEALASELRGSPSAQPSPLGSMIDPSSNRGNDWRARRQEVGRPYSATLADLSRLRRDLMGPAHRSNGRSLADLGLQLMSERDFRPARERLAEAIPFLESALGPRHPAVANLYDKFAECAVNTGRYAAAAEASARAAEIWELFPEPDRDPLMVGVAWRYTAWYQALAGDFEQAERTAQKSADQLLKAVGRDHYAVANAMCIRAWALAELGRLRESEELAQEGLRIAMTSSNIPPDQRKDIQGMYGLVLVQLGRPDEAEPLLDEVLRTHVRKYRLALLTPYARALAGWARQRGDSSRAVEFEREYLLPDE